MPSYKRRQDMVPGDVYYSESPRIGYASLLVQVLDEDTELTLENVLGGPLPEPRTIFDGMFCGYDIFELVEEENGETE